MVQMFPRKSYTFVPVVILKCLFIGIQQFGSAISDLTHVEQETNEETQRKAAAALAERTDSIMRLMLYRKSIFNIDLYNIKRISQHATAKNCKNH